MYCSKRSQAFKKMLCMNYYLLEVIHKKEEFAHRRMTDKVMLS